MTPAANADNELFIDLRSDLSRLFLVAPRTLPLVIPVFPIVRVRDVKKVKGHGFDGGAAIVAGVVGQP